MNDDPRPGLDVDDPWQAVEACFAQEWTDGLPVVPPTAALVERMLAGGPWRADAVLLHEPVRDRAGTAWHPAIQGAMGRGPPQDLPLLGAAPSRHRRPAFPRPRPAPST